MEPIVQFRKHGYAIQNPVSSFEFLCGFLFAASRGENAPSSLSYCAHFAVGCRFWTIGPRHCQDCIQVRSPSGDERCEWATTEPRERVLRSRWCDCDECACDRRSL